jgi:hypothetical protein
MAGFCFGERFTDVLAGISDRIPCVYHASDQGTVSAVLSSATVFTVLAAAATMKVPSD